MIAASLSAPSPAFNHTPFLTRPQKKLTRAEEMWRICFRFFVVIEEIQPMTVQEHNRTALAIARVGVFFAAVALPKSWFALQLQRTTGITAQQQSLNDSLSAQ